MGRFLMGLIGVGCGRHDAIPNFLDLNAEDGASRTSLGLVSLSRFNNADFGRLAEKQSVVMLPGKCYYTYTLESSDGRSYVTCEPVRSQIHKGRSKVKGRHFLIGEVLSKAEHVLTGYSSVLFLELPRQISRYQFV